MRALVFQQNRNFESCLTFGLLYLRAVFGFVALLIKFKRQIVEGANGTFFQLWTAIVIFIR